MSILQQFANKNLIFRLQTATKITITTCLESLENQKITDIFMSCNEQEHRQTGT